MHYFSIHDQSGQHIGFFVLLADDESEARPQSGRFAVKLEDGAGNHVLSPFGQTEVPQYWRVVKDRIELFFDEALVGTLRNEYLTVSGQTFVLNDLTGNM
ncbi:HLGFF motif protein [Neisseria polysaccharea]|uniref:HLGFF motif protein n=1 Tax=Neisseria polysaccharea TaxID=489 RepID=UPI0001D9D7B3|nr:hypothetical protein [Neisseria polysaccharea]EFH23231.1 hypothetical protein NEIPOLOT_00923 [Neisseria polysaccharea ATCC 43768]